MLDVITTISTNDAMKGIGDQAYLSVGERVPRVIRAAQEIAGCGPTERILDYGCGHGRVMRWLRAAYPDAEVSGADVLEDAVLFCAETFGAKPVHIDTSFAETDLGGVFDLIWLGSIYTHLSLESWHELTDLMVRHLAADGMLCFSVAGRSVAQKYAEGQITLRPTDAPAVDVMLDDYNSRGFGFMARTRTTEVWGRSIVRSDALLDFLAARDLTCVLYAPNSYGKQQDIVCVRPSTANRPTPTSGRT